MENGKHTVQIMNLMQMEGHSRQAEAGQQTCVRKSKTHHGKGGLGLCGKLELLESDI
jgi:hypothetical protein